MEQLLSLYDTVCCSESCDISCEVCKYFVDGKCTSMTAEQNADTDSSILSDENNKKKSVR